MGIVTIRGSVTIRGIVTIRVHVTIRGKLFWYKKAKILSETG